MTQPPGGLIPFTRPWLDDAELPVTDRVASTLLGPPLHPLLTRDEVGRVIHAVRGTGRAG